MKIRNLIAIILLSFFSIISVISVFLLYFLIFMTPKVKEHEKTEILLYQEITTHKNHTTNGFVYAPKREISTYPLIYNHPNSDTISILSEFTNNSQFKCSGTCTCTPSRRTTLTRPLFLLFSAVSSTIALKMAEKILREQCLTHFSSSLDCDEESIELTEEELQCFEHEEEEEEEELSEDTEEFVVYQCTGTCFRSDKMRSPSTLLEQKKFEKKIGGCESLKMTGHISILRKQIDMVSQFRYEKKGEIYKNEKEKLRDYPNRFATQNMNAKIAFAKAKLISFCRINSIVGYNYEYPKKKKKWFRQGQMCVGASKRMMYGNVKCYMVSKRRAARWKEFLPNRDKK